MWTIARYSKKPDGTHCIHMAYEFKLKFQQPIESAVDKATQASREKSTSSPSTSRGGTRANAKGSTY